MNSGTFSNSAPGKLVVRPVWTNISNPDTMLTAPTGTALIRVAMPIAEQCYGAAYGNGRFVVVASNNYYSLDRGATWTQGGAAAATRSVIFGAGLFVAFTNVSGSAFTSPDGVTWTARTVPATTSTWVMAWNGTNKFVALTTAATVAATSPDGITWTVQTSLAAASGVAWGAGKFVAVGASGANATSPDGVTWTAGPPFALPSGDLFAFSSIAHNGKVFCAFSSNGNCAVSIDGADWKAYSVLPTQGLRVIATGNGGFITPISYVAARVTTIIATAVSPDGINWRYLGALRPFSFASTAPSLSHIASDGAGSIVIAPAGPVNACFVYSDPAASEAAYIS